MLINNNKKTTHKPAKSVVTAIFPTLLFSECFPFFLVAQKGTKFGAIQLEKFLGFLASVNLKGTPVYLQEDCNLMSKDAS